MTVNVLPVPAARWRAACEDAATEGARLRCLYAVDGERGPELRALLGLADEERVLTASLAGAPVDSVLEVSPAADWDEREAHDLYGVRFAGREPLRALAAHPPQPDRWITPVRGHGTHQVAVGP